MDFREYLNSDEMTEANGKDVRELLCTIVDVLEDTGVKLTKNQQKNLVIRLNQTLDKQNMRIVYI